MQYLSATTILVHEYDPAIAWFCDKLCFVLKQDIDLGGGKRWVTMFPDPLAQTGFVIARATTPSQIAAIGNQHGGRVGFFLSTDDFDGTYHRMVSHGVTFRETPRSEPYGKVVVFEDFAGNGWDLLESKAL
jgi:catechol 2,3-dioxygenase-like lactoylglutathione lyase family enzyme